MSGDAQYSGAQEFICLDCGQYILHEVLYGLNWFQRESLNIHLSILQVRREVEDDTLRLRNRANNVVRTKYRIIRAENTSAQGE